MPLTGNPTVGQGLAAGASQRFVCTLCADELETTVPGFLKRRNKHSWYPKYVHFLTVSVLGWTGWAKAVKAPLERARPVFCGCVEFIMAWPACS